MRDWHALADRLGPQTAAYQFDGDWFDDAGNFLLRTVRCTCGASVMVIDEGEAIPPGEYLCSSCQIREAFHMEDDWSRWYWPRRLIDALRQRLTGLRQVRSMTEGGLTNDGDADAGCAAASL